MINYGVVPEPKQSVAAVVWPASHGPNAYTYGHAGCWIAAASARVACGLSSCGTNGHDAAAVGANDGRRSNGTGTDDGSSADDAIAGTHDATIGTYDAIAAANDGKGRLYSATTANDDGPRYAIVAAHDTAIAYDGYWNEW